MEETVPRGWGGIRTHGAVTRHRRFQVYAVMTTSAPNQVWAVLLIYRTQPTWRFPAFWFFKFGEDTPVWFGCPVLSFQKLSPCFLGLFCFFSSNVARPQWLLLYWGCFSDERFRIIFLTFVKSSLNPLVKDSEDLHPFDKFLAYSTRWAQAISILMLLGKKG